MASHSIYKCNDLESNISSCLPMTYAPSDEVPIVNVSIFSFFTEHTEMTAMRDDIVTLENE